MRPVRLRFREPVSLPVEAGGLAPATLSGLSTKELERLTLQVGNSKLPLAELAEVHPGEDETLIVEAAFPTLDGLGRGMTRGRLEVYGDVGAYLGQNMKGGRIELFGSAGPYAAVGMHEGLIHITAHAGDFLGAALPGGRLGMTGGVVLVGGDAGERVGDRMRRGLVVVTGHIGDYAASRMIGGTIVALHGCGVEAGYAMRRGTLVLGRAPAALLRTFADNGVHTLPWLGLLDHELARHPPAPSLPGLRAERWTGCASVGGKGEILIVR